jgi:hypothetical protein
LDVGFLLEEREDRCLNVTGEAVAAIGKIPPAFEHAGFMFSVESVD